MDKKLGEAVKAGKFAIVGVANTLIDYGMFTLLTRFGGVQVYLANVIGYACGMLNSYVFNRAWTFKAQDKFFSPALVKFIVLNLCMLGLSTGLLYLFYDLAGLPELVAKAGATVVTLAVNFVCNRLWVFKGQKS